MLTNLAGKKKVQFYQEKQWQTKSTPRCGKYAYRSNLLLHLGRVRRTKRLELARDLTGEYEKN